eukprot:Gb_37862 [translate_table: standard]
MIILRSNTNSFHFQCNSNLIRGFWKGVHDSPHVYQVFTDMVQ